MPFALLHHNTTTDAVYKTFAIPRSTRRYSISTMSEVKQEAQLKLAESTQAVPQSTAAQQSDNVAHALAGAGGGLLSMALTYPLITLSTRAQVESKRAQSSTLGAARRIIKREGIAGLYAGMDSALFGITVTNFIYYYCTAPSHAHSSTTLT